MSKDELFKLWQRLWLEHAQTHVEHDPELIEVLDHFAAIVSRKAVQGTLDQALNSGDGSYKP